jgi:hypothetical protein
MKYFILLSVFISVGCEQTFNLTTPTAPSPGTTNITNTNTNTNTNNNDKTGSDTGPVTNPNTPNDGNGVIPLPDYGEAVVHSVANSNATLLANSCQEKYGESAWAFLDLAIRTLKVRDDRWGYLCKNAECSAIARDIIAYRASSGNTGIWIVDVIGNHCPGPSDPPPAVRWGVLPFETIRPWIGTRR